MTVIRPVHRSVWSRMLDIWKEGRTDSRENRDEDVKKN